MPMPIMAVLFLLSKIILSGEKQRILYLYSQNIFDTMKQYPISEGYMPFLGY